MGTNTYMFGFIVPIMFGLCCFTLSLVNCQTVQPRVRVRVRLFLEKTEQENKTTRHQNPSL